MLKEHNIPVYEKLEEVMNKNNRAIVVTATGTGKSYLTLEYVNNHNLKTLVVVPRLSIGREWDKLSNKINVITYHSFVRTHNFDKYDMIVFDEVHHAGAATWEGPITEFINNTDKLVIGLTADPKRYSDGARDMGEALFKDCRVDGYDLTNAIENKILPKLTYVAALWNVGSIRETYKNRDIPAPLLARFNYSMDKCKPIEEIITERMPNGNRKGIIFVETISATKQAEKLIKSIYPDEKIWIIHSKQAAKLNDRYHNEFKETKTGYMIAVDMYNEGLHAPGVNTIIMLRRTSSPTIFYQQIGRALHVGKANSPIIFDCVSNKELLKVTSSNRPKIKGPSLIHNVPEISDQAVVYDYTKDILDVIKDIDMALDSSWTDEEVFILAEYYPTEGYQGIMKRLPGRTRESIQWKAKKLRITSEKHWTEDEDEILRKYYPTEGTSVSKRLENRSAHACTFRANKLGLRAYNKTWTEDDDKILKELYPTGGMKKVCPLLNKSEHIVRQRVHELGLEYLGHNAWSKEELDILHEYYPTEGPNVYKRLPNRTKAVVSKKAQTEGLLNRVVSVWSEEEDEILRKYYPVEGQKVAPRLNNKSASSIKSRVAKLGIYWNGRNKGKKD